MVDDARLAIGPRRLAIHARIGWKAGCQAEVLTRSRTIEELKRVNRTGPFADLEVKLRRPHLPGLTRLGNDLAALDGITALHHQFTRMGICGDITVGVPHQNQIAIAFEFVARISHDTVFRRLYRR